MAPTEGALVLLGIVGLVCLAILVWTGRRRFPLRIGTGNFFRRKTQVAIVVAGLLIGTAIIASSYVIQSTFDYTIRAAVFRNLDHVDELVYVAASDGTRQPFDLAVFQSLDANRSRMPHVDGLAPRYQVGVSVVDATSGLFEPSASGMGFDASHELGTFIRLDGSSWDGAGLGGSEAVLNEKLAKAVEAKIGDGLIVYIGAAGAGAPLTVTVKEIVLDEGRGAWNDAANLFVRLDVLQTGLGQPGRINTIAVSNLGGVAEGYLISEDAVREVAGELPTAPSFTVAKVKADAIEQSTQGVIQISQLFTLLGSFTIIAGILLIVNIFVMLAEERKGEMGVARALGMRRSNLVQSFVAEGMFYAVLSAAVGSLAGLLVAGLILWGFEQAFPAQLLGGVRFVLTWTPADLIQAFAIGFLITMATIGIASFRISKLNIVRAIRDIPEPVPQESTRRELAVGIALVGTGVLATLYAFATESALLQDVGPVALAIGLAVLVMRRLSPRVAFSPAGVFIIAWLLLPNRPVAPSADEIALFILAGLFLVLGGLLIVLFNSDTLLAVATRVVRRRT